MLNLKLNDLVRIRDDKNKELYRVVFTHELPDKIGIIGIELTSVEDVKEIDPAQLIKYIPAEEQFYNDLQEFFTIIAGINMTWKANTPEGDAYLKNITQKLIMHYMNVR